MFSINICNWVRAAIDHKVTNQTTGFSPRMDSGKVVYQARVYSFAQHVGNSKRGPISVQSTIWAHQLWNWKVPEVVQLISGQQTAATVRLDFNHLFNTR